MPVKKHHDKLSKTERLEQKNDRWRKRQNKKARQKAAKLAAESATDPIQQNSSYLQTITGSIQSAIQSLTKSTGHVATGLGQALQSHPLLTTVGIGLLTATVVEALNQYSVGDLPAGVGSECRKTDIALDFFDVPQCKTFGMYQQFNDTVQLLVGQLYDQLTGSRQLFDGSADCLVSSCNPSTAMSEIYGECIEATMKSVLESVLGTAERLGDPILDAHPSAQDCVVNMPDWRVARSEKRGKNTVIVYDVLVSAVEVHAPALLPDICTRFQVGMLGKADGCKDTTALFLENAKRTAIILGVVVGALAGVLILGGGAYIGYQKVRTADCTIPSCSPCGEESMFRRAMRGMGACLEGCLRACTSPFVACYEWATGRGQVTRTADGINSVVIQPTPQNSNNGGQNEFTIEFLPVVTTAYGSDARVAGDHSILPQEQRGGTLKLT